MKNEKQKLLVNKCFGERQKVIAIITYKPLFLEIERQELHTIWGLRKIRNRKSSPFSDLRFKKLAFRQRNSEKMVNFVISDLKSWHSYKEFSKKW